MGKSYKDLTFADDFVFCTIMDNKPEIAKGVLELILDKKISKVKSVSKQKSLDSKFESKGVRLDVYLKDEENKVYNIEMQTIIDKELPKRSRYYHSMMDVDQISKGDKYKKLRDTYVIFICKYPIYEDEDEPVYVFERRCATHLQRTLNDGSITVLVNACCRRDDLSEQMKIFLNYVNTGQGALDSELTAQIDSEVMRIKSNEYLEASYMLFELRMEEKRKEGFEEGVKQGALSNLIDLAKEKIISIDVAAEKAGISVEDFQKLLDKKN